MPHWIVTLLRGADSKQQIRTKLAAVKEEGKKPKTMIYALEGANFRNVSFAAQRAMFPSTSAVVSYTLARNLTATCLTVYMIWRLALCRIPRQALFNRVGGERRNHQQEDVPLVLGGWVAAWPDGLVAAWLGSRVGGWSDG